MPFLSIRIPPPSPQVFLSTGEGGGGKSYQVVFFLRLSYVDRRNRIVLYDSEAWSCEQLHAGTFRNPAGIIVWCHSMVP